MADDTNDTVATTRNTGRAKNAADDAEKGREAVSMTAPDGGKVSAPKRSVARLKAMGFK